MAAALFLSHLLSCCSYESCPLYLFEMCVCVFFIFQASGFLGKYCSKQLECVSPASTDQPDSSSPQQPPPLFDYLLKCVSNCIKVEMDLSLPIGPHLARAVLLAVHAECEDPSSGQ